MSFYRPTVFGRSTFGQYEYAWEMAPGFLSNLSDSITLSENIAKFVAKQYTENVIVNDWLVNDMQKAAGTWTTDTSGGGNIWTTPSISGTDWIEKL